MRRFDDDDETDFDEFRGVTGVSFEIESARLHVKYKNINMTEM